MLVGNALCKAWAPGGPAHSTQAKTSKNQHPWPRKRQRQQQPKWCMQQPPTGGAPFGALCTRISPRHNAPEHGQHLSCPIRPCCVMQNGQVIAGSCIAYGCGGWVQLQPHGLAWTGGGIRATPVRRKRALPLASYVRTPLGVLPAEGPAPTCQGLWSEACHCRERQPQPQQTTYQIAALVTNLHEGCQRQGRGSLRPQHSAFAKPSQPTRQATPRQAGQQASFRPEQALQQEPGSKQPPGPQRQAT